MTFKKKKKKKKKKKCDTHKRPDRDRQYQCFLFVLIHVPSSLELCIHNYQWDCEIQTGSTK